MKNRIDNLSSCQIKIDVVICKESTINLDQPRILGYFKKGNKNYL